jgi:hypothetical protein
MRSRVIHVAALVRGASFIYVSQWCHVEAIFAGIRTLPLPNMGARKNFAHQMTFEVCLSVMFPPHNFHTVKSCFEYCVVVLVLVLGDFRVGGGVFRDRSEKSHFASTRPRNVYIYTA